MSLLFLEGTKMYNINNLTVSKLWLYTILLVGTGIAVLHILQKLMNTSHDNYYVDFYIQVQVIFINANHILTHTRISFTSKCLHKKHPKQNKVAMDFFS